MTPMMPSDESALRAARPSRWWLAVGCVLAAACGGDTAKSSGDGGLDADGDGFAAEDGDCDDADPLVSPASDEICDGIDNNCDGVVDEGVTEIWYPDADGDGFGADAESTEACSRPVGFVPGATDCNDADAGVFPGALEVCDGVDTDCDEIPDPITCRPLETSDYKIHGAVDGMRLGASLASLDDWDGDGNADLAIGAPDHDAAQGTVLVFRGPFSTETLSSDDAYATLSGADDGDATGSALAGLPDLNGDGRSELAVGTWGEDAGGNAAGAVTIHAGGSVGAIDLDDFLVRYEGERPGQNLGIALDFVGDIDQDGSPDLVVGAPGDDDSGIGSGVALLMPTRTDGSTVSAADAIGRIHGAVEGDFLGQVVNGPGDLGGDGLPDLLVAAPGDDVGGEDAGAFFILDGPISSDRTATDAIAAWYGEAAGDQAGGSIGTPGDVNDDGYADLVIGAPDQDIGGDGAGLIYIVYGPTTGTSTLANADARILGRQPGDRAGNAVDATADIDGDGRRDVLVGAYIDDSAAINAGAAYLVLGPWSGTSYLTDAQGGFIGEAEADLAGWAVNIAGDLDGGGTEDLVVGAPGGDTDAAEGGSVYVIASEGLVF